MRSLRAQLLTGLSLVVVGYFLPVLFGGIGLVMVFDPDDMKHQQVTAESEKKSAHNEAIMELVFGAGIILGWLLMLVGVALLGYVGVRVLRRRLAR